MSPRCKRQLNWPPPSTPRPPFHKLKTLRFASGNEQRTQNSRRKHKEPGKEQSIWDRGRGPPTPATLKRCPAPPFFLYIDYVYCTETNHLLLHFEDIRRTFDLQKMTFLTSSFEAQKSAEYLENAIENSQFYYTIYYLLKKSAARGIASGLRG